jgi:type IV secretion system protein TrbC
MIRDFSLFKRASRWGGTTALRPIWMLLLAATLATPVFAASPWENAVAVLVTAFTGPIARGLSLVAMVIGGLLFAFGDGDAKRTFGGIVFGVGMAVSAPAFMGWLFQ